MKMSEISEEIIKKASVETERIMNEMYDFPVHEDHMEEYYASHEAIFTELLKKYASSSHEGVS